MLIYTSTTGTFSLLERRRGGVLGSRAVKFSTFLSYCKCHGINCANDSLSFLYPNRKKTDKETKNFSNFQLSYFHIAWFVKPRIKISVKPKFSVPLRKGWGEEGGLDQIRYLGQNLFVDSPLYYNGS